MDSPLVQQEATRGQCGDMAAGQQEAVGGGGERRSSNGLYQCLSLAPLSGTDW